MSKTSAATTARDEFEHAQAALIERIAQNSGRVGPEVPSIFSVRRYKLGMMDTVLYAHRGGSPRHVRGGRLAAPFFSLQVREHGRMERTAHASLKSTLADRRLVGCIPESELNASDTIRLIAVCQGLPINSTRAHGTRSDQLLRELRWNTPLRNAEPLIDLLSLSLTRDGTLFSLNKDEQGLHLYCEGQIVRIEPAT